MMIVAATAINTEYRWGSPIGDDGPSPGWVS